MKRSQPQQLHKEFCEIEGCPVREAAILDYHHIVERTEIGTSNHPMNLCVLCSNHHRMIHAGKLKILGVFPGTKPPSGRILIYEIDGKCNIPGFEGAKPYFQHQAPQMKITLKGPDDKK